MSEDASPRTRYCSRCLTTFTADPERCPNLGCRTPRSASGWGDLLETGELLDRTYRIHSRLAIGGAGVTYLAREVGKNDLEMGPELAVKVLYQQRDQGPYLRRLATEAQILQGLNHPQIVECRGFVHRSGHSPYLVTRFESGGSLLDHIRRVGAIPLPITASIGVQVCDALAVAHRQGVIHRDLKPENVLLESIVDRDTVPNLRVADFGIAKVFGGVGDRLTRVGAFIGTPQYAAPEQFEGVAPVPATDVYAVGALVYFCLTMRPIAEYMADLDIEDQREQLVRALPPRLPQLASPEREWIEGTLAVAMAPDPGDRCAIDVLAERLHAIAAGRDPGPATLPGGPSSQLAGNAGQRGLAPSNTDTISAHPKAAPRSPGWAAAAGPPAGGAAAAGGGAGAAQPQPIPADRRSVATSVPSIDSDSEEFQQLRVTAERNAANSQAGSDRGAGSGGVDLHPVPTIDRTPPRGSSAATTGIGCLAGGGVLLGLAAVIGLGAWLTLRDDARTLSSSSTDPTVKAEWQALAVSLGVEGVKAERACAAPAYLGIEVVVEEDGKARDARLLNYPHPPTEACIARELTKARFPRTSKGAVRLAVTMTQ